MSFAFLNKILKIALLITNQFELILTYIKSFLAIFDVDCQFQCFRFHLDNLDDFYW